MKLDKTELSEVSGGFSELNESLPTAGLDIKCPKCGTGTDESFSKSVLYDPDLGSVEYRCKCGCSFVCYQGRVHMKDDFIALCKANKINYRFC